MSSTINPFKVTNNIPLSVSFDAQNGTVIPDSQIWIAIYGQLIFNKGAGTVPNPGTNYYLDANQLDANKHPVPQLTTDLPQPGTETPDAVILPSYTLKEWGVNLFMPIPGYTDTPGLTQFTGRVVISIGSPVQAQVAAKSGDVASPSASNSEDPSNGTFCDFLEFTVQSNKDGTNNADFDTSQVDSFGLPLQLQFFQEIAGQQKPFNSGPYDGHTTKGSTQITLSTALPANIKTKTLISGIGIAEPGFINDISTDRKTITINQPAIATGATQITAIFAGPVGVKVARADIFGSGALSFSTFIQAKIQSNPAATLFKACDPASQTGMPPLRLISPKDLAEMYNPVVKAGIATYSDDFNNYYNSMIDAFFLLYYSGTTASGHNGGGKTFKIVSNASTEGAIYQGSVVKNGSNYALQLTDATKTETYLIYYPFFTNVKLTNYQPIFETGPFPAWLPKQTESASQMVFACDGVFADSAQQPISATNTNNNYRLVLGDIEDSISAAFNRGIILNDPSTWGDTTTWYDASIKTNKGIYTYWVQYWHQAGLMLNGLAYAFAYDDKYGASTNMQESSVSKIQVTLGSWGKAALPEVSITLPKTGAPLTQKGPINPSVQVTGKPTATPTGTISFFLDGYPLNPAGYADAIPVTKPVTLTNGTASQKANCPPLSGGSFTHTYTLTAVYSGDGNYLPAVASTSVQLNGPATFIFNPPKPTIVLGQALSENLQVQLPVTEVNGTLKVSVMIKGGNNSKTLLANSVQEKTVTTNPITVAPYTVPPLTFTGDLEKGSADIKNVTNFEGIAVGQTLSGDGILAGAKIDSFVPGNKANPGKITINNATLINATTTGVTIASDGKNSGFEIDATYTPAQGGTAIVVNPPFGFTPS